MRKYISFGNYNKLYKYIFYFLFFKLIYEYFFNPKNLPDKITIDYLKNDLFINNNILVQDTFNYLGIFIISLYLFLSKYKTKNKPNLKKSNEINMTSNINLIYNKNDNEIIISTLSLSLIISLYVVCMQLKNMYNVLGLKELNYWMFEMLSICFITSSIFKTEIYNFKKLSIGIIIIFSTTFKFFSTFHSLKDNKDYIYKEYIWLIPIGIISIILIFFGRDYSLCKIKFLFDLKYFSIFKFLIWLGLLGVGICLLGGIISTIIPCKNNNNIDYLCKINYKNNLYYDNFKVYFKNIWKEEKVIINIFRILIVLSQIFINFITNLYLFLIVQKLSPEYYICSVNIFHFILELVKIICDYSYVTIYNLLAEFFSIFGTLIYLEFIELNFFQLDYYLKKNIGKRGEIDSSIEDLYSGDDSFIYN